MMDGRFKREEEYMGKLIYTFGVIATVLVVLFVIALLYVAFAKKNAKRWDKKTKVGVVSLCLLLITLIILAWF